MRNKKDSPTLGNKLEKQTHPWILQSLEDLKNLWVDPDVFDHFKSKIEGIIEENPACEEVVVWELGKTLIRGEALVIEYNRQFRSIFEKAANDDIGDNSLAA